MTKKDKKPKINTLVTKEGESIRVFDDLAQFEGFLKDGAEDDQLENLHCRLNYYPPFVLHESHNDPEKIKDSANSHSKKYVRHLHQHIEKHLLKDIRESMNMPELKFKNKSKQEDFDRITWSYADRAGGQDKSFDVQISVTCKHDDAMVDLDYVTGPVEHALV